MAQEIQSDLGVTHTPHEPVKLPLFLGDSLAAQCVTTNKQGIFLRNKFLETLIHQVQFKMVFADMIQTTLEVQY